jgi:hypothetical protein
MSKRNRRNVGGRHPLHECGDGKEWRDWHNLPTVLIGVPYLKDKSMDPPLQFSLDDESLNLISTGAESGASCSALYSPGVPRLLRGPQGLTDLRFKLKHDVCVLDLEQVHLSLF